MLFMVGNEENVTYLIFVDNKKKTNKLIINIYRLKEVH